jgi:hypothetical protein
MTSDQFLLTVFTALMLFNIFASVVYMVGLTQVKATLRKTFRKG